MFGLVFLLFICSFGCATKQQSSANVFVCYFNGKEVSLNDADKCYITSIIINGNWKEGIIDSSNDFEFYLNGQKVFYNLNAGMFYNRNDTKYMTVNGNDANQLKIILKDNLLELDDCFISYDYKNQVFDNTTVDLDNNGIKEDWYISYGITSGIFTFVITVVENGEKIYQNMFATVHADVSFCEDDGIFKLLMNIPNCDNYPNIEYTAHKLLIHIENNNVIIDNIEDYKPQNYSTDYLNKKRQLIKEDETRL